MAIGNETAVQIGLIVVGLGGLFAMFSTVGGFIWWASSISKDVANIRDTVTRLATDQEDRIRKLEKEARS